MKNLIVSLICLLIIVEARSMRNKRDTSETIDLIEASKNGDIETIQSLSKNEINFKQIYLDVMLYIGRQEKVIKM